MIKTELVNDDNRIKCIRYFEDLINNLDDRDFEDGYEYNSFVSELEYVVDEISRKTIKNFFVIENEEGQIVGYADTYKFNGVTIWIPEIFEYGFKYTSEFAEYVKNQEETIVVFSEDSDGFFNHELYLLDYTSSKCPNMKEEKYRFLTTFDYSQAAFVNKKDKRDILTKKLEEKIFVDNKKEITVSNISSEDLNEFIMDNRNEHYIFGFPKWINNSGVINYAGFRYFTPEQSREDLNYIVAMQDKNIVGVLQYGLYSNSGVENIGVCYIDVKTGFRGKGIAKKLVEEFNKALDGRYPVFLTEPSDMGRMHGMEKLFKEMVTNTDVVKYHEQDEYVRKIKDKRRNFYEEER